MPKPTAFARDLEHDLRDPKFREAYTTARARIDAIDGIIRQLDEARARLGLSKAELARRVGVNEVAIRRLFTAEGANPTMKTLVNVASVLGLELRVLPPSPHRAPSRTGAGSRNSPTRRRSLA